jgi:hypothetical protein
MKQYAFGIGGWEAAHQAGSRRLIGSGTNGKAGTSQAGFSAKPCGVAGRNGVRWRLVAFHRYWLVSIKLGFSLPDVISIPWDFH